MKYVASSEATYAALRAASGEAIHSALVPEGYWHEFRSDLKAYSPGAIRLEMKSGGALELWSEYVRPIVDPWCEPFVLAARYRVGPNLPWNGAPVAVELSWQSSPPLVQLLVGRNILNFEDLPEETVWSEDDEIVLAPKGARMNVFGGSLNIILNLEPAAFLVSASDMPEYRSAPTGELQWLSRTYKRAVR
jgi:hypothetical protein